MAAAVAYADTLGREHPEQRAEAYELAELLCRQARRRAETLFPELWHDDDDENRAAAQVLDGRYRWLENGIADPAGDRPMIPDEVKESAAGWRLIRFVGGALGVAHPSGRDRSHSVSWAAGTGRLR